MQAVYDLVYRAVASGCDDQAIPCQSGELGGVIRALGVQHFYLEATGAQGLRAALEVALAACAPRVRVSDYDSVASHLPYYKPFCEQSICRTIPPVDGFVVPGIGVDVVDVERMKFALERTPRIRRRLFTEEEIAYCEKFRFAERHYAGRWAAKEAVTKALGCGLIQWNGVEVMRRPRQAPTVRIFGKIERFADMVGVRQEDLFISITHSELSAVAVCVVRGMQ